MKPYHLIPFTMAGIIASGLFYQPAFADQDSYSTRPALETVEVISNINSNPYGLNLNTLTNKIYIANYNDAGTITVIDGKTNTVANTIAVGDDSVQAPVNLNSAVHTMHKDKIFINQ